MLLMALTIFLGLAGRAHATKYYVAANGSDSNNGTSESSPWQHAPGMTNCTANCAAKTPQPGDSFIFRGGDAWHRSANVNDANDVAMGGTWNWTWSGSGLGVTCNYPSATSTCIYLGVDTTTPWYNSSVCGSSFCRPQLELDNPIWANSSSKDSSHPGFVTGCTYSYSTSATGSGSNGMSLNAKGVILDNWNEWGKCWTGIPSSTGCEATDIWVNSQPNQYVTVIDGYFHGWTETYNPQANGGTPMDQCSILGGAVNPGASHNVFAYNAFDGSDSCPYSTAGYQDSQPRCDGGPVLYGDCYEFYSNVVRYISNVCSPNYNSVAWHDNLIEDVYESYDPADHGEIAEASNPPNDCPPYNQSFYNNTIRNTNIGIVWEISTCGGYSTYVYNNVFWNVNNATNCIVLDGTQSPSPQIYITNNTFDRSQAACEVRLVANPSPDGIGLSITFQNNHLIGGYGSPLNASSNLFNICAGCSATITDAGSEVFQSEAAANGQGYTQSNNYQPTSTSGATYHAGADLSLQCAVYSPGSALCSGSTGAVMDISGSGIVPIPMIAAPLLRGAAWDAGAYQYSESASSQPTPPMGLIASVQ